MDDIKVLFEIVAIVVGTLVAIVGIGWLIGSRHQALLNMIASVKETLDKHISDEDVVFKRIEAKIKKIESCVNGQNLR